MIKKYVSKFTIDILPSIIATIVGAYIVTHYINPKADTGKPAAAVASAPDVAIDSKAVVASPADKSPDAADAPAVVAPKAKVEKASIDKAEPSASEPKRHQPAIREKAVAKATPAPVAVTPPVTTVSVAPAETAPTPEERRDANDLARAAIERLRSVKETQPAAQEATRAPEAPHSESVARSVVASPAQQPPAPSSLQQLPPPINVSTPAIETYGSAPSRPPYAPERSADSRRLRPPGEIPSPPPLDLQADATGSTRERTNVAEDVLSAAKSVFHSVIPRQFER